MGGGGNWELQLHHKVLEVLPFGTLSKDNVMRCLMLT